MNDLNDILLDDNRIKEYINKMNKDYIYDTMKELKNEYKALNPDITAWDFKELIDHNKCYHHEEF